MAEPEENRIPWFLWPFWALWRLLTLILGATGRLVAAILGIALMVVGLVVSLTVVGAPIGIPLDGGEVVVRAKGGLDEVVLERDVESLPHQCSALAGPSLDDE